MKLQNLVGEALYELVVEIREESESYEEVVILTKDLSDWENVLSEKLGFPVVSSDENKILGSLGDDEQSKIGITLQSAESYGGISEGQTLYHGVYDSAVILILVWPWEDNMSVTIKKAVLN